MPQVVKIPCKIRRSAFSGERIVLFTLAGQQHKTTAPVHYCRTLSGDELSEMDPKPGDEIDGTVSVPVTYSENRAHVRTPDGEFIDVSDHEVRTLKAS
jgi:hypothetical protein